MFQCGRLDSHYPKVCGHQGNVLDIKWNPFFENIIASCSEDTSVSSLYLKVLKIISNGRSSIVSTKLLAQRFQR